MPTSDWRPSSEAMREELEGTEAGNGDRTIASIKPRSDYAVSNRYALVSEGVVIGDA